MEIPAIPDTINLIIEEGPDRINGEDLLRITEAAGSTKAVLHISTPSRQILVGVSAEHQARLLESLREMGLRVDRGSSRESTNLYIRRKVKKPDSP
jgi:hypothetical protein